MYQFFSYVFISVGLFIPIVIWAYVFTFIDGSSLAKKRFLFGILAGVVSVIPILYMEGFFHLLGLGNLSIFKGIYSLGNTISYIYLLGGLIIMSLWMSLIPLLKLIFSQHRSHALYRTISSIATTYGILLVGFLVVIFATQVFFSSFPSLNIFISESIYFEGYIFNSLKLVLLYYAVIAIIEETSKYFYFSGTNLLRIESITSGVLATIFIALGFSFIENILYTLSLYGQLGASGELVKIALFRSIFSTMLHVLCSTVISYGFLVFYFSKDTRKAIIMPLLFTFTIGILLHLFYDLALSVGLGLVVLIYLVGGYFYIGSLFYKDISGIPKGIGSDIG